MALFTTHNQTSFGVGDRVRVTQRITEGEKTRLQAFEGIVIGIRGRDDNKSFTVRKIGAGQIGIERIFPLATPTIDKIEVTRKGHPGSRHAKLYFIRNKSKREIEKIYSRTHRQELAAQSAKSKVKKSKENVSNTPAKKPSKKN